MSKFERYFYKCQSTQEEIGKLRNISWFKYLEEDVRAGKVFPALRQNEIDFYYKGALLCHYKGNPNGDPKAICNHSGKEGLFNPDDRNAYEEIKKNCRLWGKSEKGKRERAELSVLVESFSPYNTDLDSNLISIDIEIGFPKLTFQNNSYTNCQIDLLFLNKNNGMLYFVEAKDANDSRIKKKSSGKSEKELYKSLDISNQLEIYNDNLKARQDEILFSYKSYLELMGEIFECKIYSDVLYLYATTKLLVYGKSSDNGRKSLEAIRSNIGNDLIVLEKGFSDLNNPCETFKSLLTT